MSNIGKNLCADNLRHTPLIWGAAGLVGKTESLSKAHVAEGSA